MPSAGFRMTPEVGEVSAQLALERPRASATEAAAEHHLKRFERGHSLIIGTHKGVAPVKTLAVARYRLGLRGRWSHALVPAGKAGRTALEAKLGSLAAFELVFPVPPPGMHAPSPRREVPPSRPWHV